MLGLKFNVIQNNVDFFKVYDIFVVRMGMYSVGCFRVVYFYFNYKDVVGFGEVNVVLNGVEF